MHKNIAVQRLAKYIAVSLSVALCTRVLAAQCLDLWDVMLVGMVAGIVFAFVDTYAPSYIIVKDDA
uniref:Uncharacterized protein n=1 Tax=Megaviridae environmental sample TaxID=1737588 RepID=A0A5J6VHX7_9VIRU|nr:MAG: hypothetical protein [Megaviridae environmental sample]